MSYFSDTIYRTIVLYCLNSLKPIDRKVLTSATESNKCLNMHARDQHQSSCTTAHIVIFMTSQNEEMLILKYSQLPLVRKLKGPKNLFELANVQKNSRNRNEKKIRNCVLAIFSSLNENMLWSISTGYTVERDRLHDFLHSDLVLQCYN